MTAGHDTSTPHPAAAASDHDAAALHPAALADRVRVLVDGYRHEPGPLLPVLHAVQDEFGYLPLEAVPMIARELNLSRADVHGVISFYRDFRTEPAGRTVVRICRAEACQSMGAEALAAAAVDHFGLALGGTSPDHELTLEQVYCLGNCALGPSVQVNGMVHGRMTVSGLAALLAGSLPSAAGSSPSSGMSPGLSGRNEPNGVPGDGSGSAEHGSAEHDGGQP